MKTRFFMIGILLAAILLVGGSRWVSAQVGEYDLFVIVCVKNDGSIRVVLDPAECKVKEGKDKEGVGYLVHAAQFIFLRDNLQGQIDGLKAQSADLQARIDNLEVQASSLQTQVNGLQGVLDTEIADRLAADSALEERIVAIEDLLTNRVVGFYKIVGEYQQVQPNQSSFYTLRCNSGDLVVSGSYLVNDYHSYPPTHEDAAKIEVLRSYPWGPDLEWRFDFYNTHVQDLYVRPYVICADMTP